MKTSNILSKIIAVVLSIAMMLPGMPVTAFAEDDVPLGASGKITAFAALDEGVAEQTVPLGTSLEALNLPDTLGRRLARRVPTSPSKVTLTATAIWSPVCISTTPPPTMDFSVMSAPLLARC